MTHNPTIPTQDTIDSLLMIQRKALLHHFSHFNCDPYSFAVWLDLYIRTIPGATVRTVAEQLECSITAVHRWRTGDRIPSKLTTRYVVDKLTLPPY